MAASGNLVNDLLEKMGQGNWSARKHVAVSQAATLLIGVLSILLALRFRTVLGGILHAYAFMVAGLSVPTFGAFFWQRSSSAGALAAMIAGGSLTLGLTLSGMSLPLGLAPSFYGIVLSALVFVPVSLLCPGKARHG